MPSFFTLTFTGGPFVLFSFQHWAAIGVIVLVNLCLPWLRGKRRAARAFRYTAAALLVINELMWHVWNAVNGQWNVQTMLPLHVCSAFVWLSAVVLVVENERLRRAVYPFAYFLGIGGATQAILTPDLGIYAFPHFRYFQVFVSHGLIVTTALYFTVVEGYRPTWGSIGRVLVGSNIYMALVGLINWAIGSNYMFIAHKPETASLIDVLGPWPWYLLALEGIGVVLFVILYLPIAIRDFVEGRKMADSQSAAD